METNDFDMAVFCTESVLQGPIASVLGYRTVDSTEVGTITCLLSLFVITYKSQTTYRYNLRTYVNKWTPSNMLKWPGLKSEWQ